MPKSISRTAPRFARVCALAGFAVLLVALISALNLRRATAAGTALSGWGFEGVTTANTGQTPSFSLGSGVADSGALTAGSAFTAFHSNASTVWSNPAGNGSAKSVSSDHWGVGDYYQFSFGTSGYTAINITWDQTGSGTGPRDFKVQYSTNGATFTDAAGANSTYSVTNDGWSGSGSPKAASRRTLDLSGVSSLNNQSTVFIRLVDNSTTNIGGTTVATAGTGRVDNFNVSGTASAAPTNPTGTGSASPSTVQAGALTLLTVAVAPGANPTSTGLGVTVNLSSIGGSSTQQFFDDGTHGDATAGDNTFSFQATVPANTSTGGKNIAATITDSQGRTGSASISLTVTPSSTSPTGTGSAAPNSLQAGNITLLTVNVTPGTNPASTGITVTGDLSSIGGPATQQFTDNGGNSFSFQATVSSSTTPGAKSLPFTVADAQGRGNSSAIALNVQTPPPPTTVKISQVYGGGGNSGSTYTNDYIELYNSGGTTVDITNWSVQYHSATSTGGWAVTPVCPAGTCTVAPGHYYLVQEAQGAGGTTALPAPDTTGTINLGATNGQVALVAGTAALPAFCTLNSSVVDLVGYGSATCFDTAAASTLSNTTAAVRRGNGCQDTDNDSADFVAVGPIPRDGASPANSCGGDATQPSGLGIASPSALDPASNVLLTVKVSPATAPPSTGLTVNADLTSIGGSATQQLYDDGTNGDLTAADNTFSFQATVAPNVTTGVKNIVATITDAQARVVTAPVTLTVQSPTCGVERWSVKVGTDADVSLVDLQHPVHTTIAQLRQFTPPPDPPGPPDNSRVVPPESTVYEVDATMTLYKKETDVDYHIVLQDESGQTVIAEIPSPACVLTPGSPRQLVTGPFSGGITSAREKFDARFTATPNFQTANVPVRVKGVAFFDFIHGQTGVAPNGIELHPVLDIEFTANTSTTLMSSANPSQYGDQIAVTATVSNGGAAATATGNVTFYDGGSPIDVVALDQNGRATFTSHTLSAGSHSITASYGGDDASAPSTSAALTQVVNKAAANVAVNGYNAPYDGHAHGATGSATGVGGEDLTSLLDLGASFTDVPGGTAHWTFAGNDNYNPAGGDAPVVITQAAAAVSINGYSGAYDGNPHGATGTVTGVGGEDLTALLNLGESFSNVPGGTAHWSFAGNNNYDPSSGTATITITQAAVNVSVSGYTGVYDGGAHGATGSATGVKGESLDGLLHLGESYTSVPGGTAHWTFDGDNNYAPSGGTAPINIAKADAVIRVNGYSVGYDGGAHTATGTATGVESPGPADLSALLDLSGTTHADAGGYPTDTWSFAGNVNYNAAAGTVADQITKAASAVTINCPPSAAYTGDALTPCTASVTSAGDLNDSLTVSYSNNTNVGKATANAVYIGDANHEGGDGSKQFDITPAAAITSVNCPPGATYTGSAIEPCTATVTGAGGLNQPLTVSYTNNVNAGVATAAAGYAGDANHTGSGGSQTFAIGKSSSTTTVTCAGGPFTYNGAAQTPCTASVTGAGGLSQSLPVAYSNNTDAGAASASASFAGDANHEGSSDSKGFAIGKATPSFGNLSSPTIAYGTVSTILSGTLGLGSLVPTGSVAITLNGVTQNAGIQAGGTFSSSFATAQLAPVSPPYAVAYSYGGDSNFNPAGGAGMLTVGYGVLALYDQTKAARSGSVIPVKLAITNAAGNNVSSAGTAVTAVGVALVSTTAYGQVEDAGDANPDNNFRFDPTLTAGGGYVFNLKTTGLATGTYNLYFRVGSDPALHAVQFQVR